MKNSENCFNCKNCIRNKRTKRYRCEFKKCSMGYAPFFPKYIPKSAIYNYGIRVCKFEPRKK